MITKLSNKIRAYNSPKSPTQRPIEWFERGPRNMDVSDARRLASRCGIADEVFDQEPEMVWVRPGEKRAMDSARLYTKFMPPKPYNYPSIGDGRTNRIEDSRVQKLRSRKMLFPVIIVQTPDNSWYVADGSHRVFIAKENNCPFRAAVYKSKTPWKLDD